MNKLTPHQSKALNIESSISLTANAGSGKTFVLSQRYLSIILNTDTPINQVAAITFTEKAAGELYRRVSNELNRLIESTSDDILKKRIEKIRKQLVSAKISTIHSFCIDLLKEFPVEASIDANFIPLDERKTQELINLSIDSSLRETFNDTQHQSDIKLLVRLLGPKENLFKQLSLLINKRKIVLNLIEKIYSFNENEIADHFKKVFKSYFKKVLSDEIFLIIKEIKIINDKVLSNDTSNETAQQINKIVSQITPSIDEVKLLKLIFELQEKILTKDGNVRKQSYLASKYRSEIENSVFAVEQFFSDIKELRLITEDKKVNLELAKYGLAMIHIFQNVLKSFENKKNELGVLDFEDILIKTRNLLSVESVKKSLSGKYKYLLIDEYQDTNEIQYEIFLPLLEDLKKGNLFIVGDEKQSIYRFRDAEPEVFSRTKNDIKKLFGEESSLTLPDSFRMAPAICFFVNSLFKILFHQPRKIFNEVAYSELVCARSDNLKGHVEFLIAEENKLSEAEIIARKIIQLKSENPELISEWSDIAVLVRKRASFSELQKEFIKYHIPFIIVGGTGFYQQQSISDIYNYFAFLLTDKDDGALIGILRSPFFNISDTNIFELSLMEGKTYWEKLRTASKLNKELWEKPFKVIDENKNLAKRINVSQLLRKILQESNFISAISSRINGIQELSNLDKLISFTNDFFNEDFNTLYDYVTFLKDAISNTEDEAQAGIDLTSNGVNILTLHQAKGLEYPAVFLYNCNDYTRMDKVKASSFSVDKNFGLLTKVPLNENYFGNYESAPIVGLYNLIESKKDLAELKRLLYVGLTRAENLLFISLTDDGKVFKKNSFAGLITDGLALDINRNSIELRGELTYLKKEADLYFNRTESINLEIPLSRNFENADKVNAPELPRVSQKKIILSEISDHSKGEVISATRYSTFSDCPAKYNLLYNYKAGDIFYQSFNKKFEQKEVLYEDYNRNELSSHLFDDKSKQSDYSKTLGKLIHYILRKNIRRQELVQVVRNQIKFLFQEENSDLIEKEIMNDLNLFYNSDEFRYINSFDNYKNEFEVYLKENDYYLFGILDKLIITDNKLIIVDYKTNDVNKDEINARAAKYLPQIQFYSYIVSRLFNNKKEVEGRIIFTKQPEVPFIFKYDAFSDKNVETGIKLMVESIRNNNYSVNSGTCKSCIFSDDKTVCNNLSS